MGVDLLIFSSDFVMYIFMVGFYVVLFTFHLQRDTSSVFQLRTIFSYVSITILLISFELFHAA